jgi:hypothetical protein
MSASFAGAIPPRVRIFKSIVEAVEFCYGEGKLGSSSSLDVILVSLNTEGQLFIQGWLPWQLKLREY